MTVGTTEKSYPASIVQQAVRYSREDRYNHTDLERIMDLLVGLQPWQILIHAGELSTEHLNKHVKIVSGRSGVLTDFEFSERGPNDAVLLVIDGKISRPRRWDDVIVYMSEE